MLQQGRPAERIYRTTIGDSWRWMRLDLVIRLIPLTLAPLLFSLLAGTPLAQLGLSFAHPVRDLAIALPLAVAGFIVAAGFAEYLARRSGRWFVPDRKDLLGQTAYYILLNAPIEEWFFRGFLQGSLVAWLKAPALGIVVVTAVFGGYHVLDRWGWRPVVGATAAGLTLALIYFWQPAPPSLLAPVIVHAGITCGFLSLGPYAIFRWRLATGSVRPLVEPVRQ